jgi:hypothetical protein
MRGQPLTVEERRAADARLIALMAVRPMASIRELARALSMDHAAVSRRAARLRMTDAIDRVGGVWVVMEPEPARACEPWVRHISTYVRVVVSGRASADEPEDCGEPVPIAPRKLGSWRCRPREPRVGVRGFEQRRAVPAD